MKHIERYLETVLTPQLERMGVGSFAGVLETADGAQLKYF